MCNLALSKEFINFGLKYHLIKIVATQLIQIDARLYLINFSKQFVQTSIKITRKDRYGGRYLIINSA